MFIFSVWSLNVSGSNSVTQFLHSHIRCHFAAQQDKKHRLLVGNLLTTTYIPSTSTSNIIDQCKHYFLNKCSYIYIDIYLVWHSYYISWVLNEDSSYFSSKRNLLIIAIQQEPRNIYVYNNLKRTSFHCEKCSPYVFLIQWEFLQWIKILKS